MQNIKSQFAEFDKVYNVTHIATKARELAMQLSPISFDSVSSFAESHSIRIRLIDGFPKAALGYSDVKDGIRYIFVNRDTSESQMIYTIVHELAHHLLGHYPISRPHTDLDLEAHVFVLFVYSITLKDDLNHEEWMRENYDCWAYGMTLALPLFFMLLVGGILDVGAWLVKKLDSQKRLN